MGSIHGRTAVPGRLCAGQSAFSGTYLLVSRHVARQQIVRRCAPKNGPVPDLGGPSRPGGSGSGKRLVPKAVAAMSPVILREPEEEMVLNPPQELLDRSSLPRNMANASDNLNALSDLCKELDTVTSDLNKMAHPQLPELTVRPPLKSHTSREV
jgi:hypothetical protein